MRQDHLIEICEAEVSVSRLAVVVYEVYNVFLLELITEVLIAFHQVLVNLLVSYTELMVYRVSPADLSEAIVTLKSLLFG